MNLYDALEDKSIIKKVNAAFYKKVYKHPWISQYFQAVTEEFITQQQTDFIVGAMGGPKTYSGRFPHNAHPHMHITEELFDLRTALLIEAMDEERAPQSLRDFWLKLDQSFRKVIVKQKRSECQGRWPTDAILDFPNPNKKAA